MCTARRGISDRTQHCAFVCLVEWQGREGKVSEEVKMIGRILGVTIIGLLQFFSPSIHNNYLLVILGQAC